MSTFELTQLKYQIDQLNKEKQLDSELEKDSEELSVIFLKSSFLTVNILFYFF